MLKKLLWHIATVSIHMDKEGGKEGKEVVAIASRDDLTLEYQPDSWTWARVQIPPDSWQGDWEGRVSIPPLSILEALPQVGDDFLLEVLPDRVRISSPDGEKTVTLVAQKPKSRSLKDEIPVSKIDLDRSDWLRLVSLAEAIGGERSVEIETTGRRLTATGLTPQFAKKTWVECNKALPSNWLEFQAIALLEANEISTILGRDPQSARVQILDTRVEIATYDAVEDSCVEVVTSKFDASSSPAFALDKMTTLCDRRSAIETKRLLAAVEDLAESRDPILAPLEVPGLVEFNVSPYWLKLNSPGEERTVTVRELKSAPKKQDIILLPIGSLLTALKDIKSKICRIQFGILEHEKDEGGDANSLLTGSLVGSHSVFKGPFSYIDSSAMLVLEDWEASTQTILFPVVGIPLLAPSVPTGREFCLQPLSLEDIMGVEIPPEERAAQVIEIAELLVEKLPMARRMELKEYLGLLDEIPIEDEQDVQDKEHLVSLIEDVIVHQVEVETGFKQMSPMLG